MGSFLAAFYYNRIAFGIAGDRNVMSWDAVANAPWTGHGIAF